MAVAFLPCCLILFFFSAISITQASSGMIGVNYGRIANNLPSPSNVVNLLKSQGINRIKIYDTDNTVLTSLAHSRIKVVVCLPNELLSRAASRQSFSDKWVQHNIRKHFPATEIEAIAVGNEVFVDPKNTTPHLVSAMKNIHASLVKVPTVVSNYQKDEASDVSVGCGRNCLGACCLNGARLPLYACKKLDKSGDGEKLVVNSEARDPPVAFLESLVLGEWEDRFQRGLFRYDVTACETKVIPGKYGFVAQLNEGRHLKKRPTEFRVDKVLQSFDGSKFNFTKVGQEELLFQFEAGEDEDAQFFPCMPLDAENSPSVVAINVSPIEYGHVLLLPRVLDCLPQRIDHKSLLLALHMASVAANPYFRLGYNSLGAFATINHLHFQAYYLAMPFPLEKASSKKMITTENSVKISELLNYPVRGLLFEGGNSMQDLSDTVSDACVFLQNNNIPFNILISDCGRQIFLMLQCYAEKQALGEVSPEVLETQVNPAVWEISGHMVLKRKEDYEGATEEKAWRLLAEASISEERFKEVNDLIFEAIGCSNQEEELEGANVNQQNTSGSVNQQSNRSHGGPGTECLVLQ